MNWKAMKAAVLSVTLLWAVPAFAEDVQVGPAKVTLTHPAKFCPFDVTQTLDKRAITMVERGLAGRNKLLGIYGLCDELPKWRTGKVPLLSDMLQYQTPASLMNQPLPKPHAGFIKQVCGVFRKQGQQILEKTGPEVNERIASVSDTIRINEQKILGVIDEPDGKCAILILQGIKTEIGTTIVQLAVFIPVLAKEKLIFAYLFVPYDKAIGPDAALDRLRAVVKTMDAANAG